MRGHGGGWDWGLLSGGSRLLHWASVSLAEQSLVVTSFTGWGSFSEQSQGGGVSLTSFRVGGALWSSSRVGGVSSPGQATLSAPSGWRAGPHLCTNSCTRLLVLHKKEKMDKSLREKDILG